ncbi:MAG: hypothetical protein ORN53_02615, partial [Crocinitomicaceae bacterium]|nr:hypothetical protein [Crocinitomicaceae bacterium]
MGGKAITIGKKNLEKDYEYFRLFRKYKINQKTVDTSKSIFLETVYQYELLRGKEYAKLFYLDNGYQAFHKTYNLGDPSALQLHIDDTLHTSNQIREIKTTVVDIESEISFFLDIYKRASAEISPQSSLDIQKTLGELKHSSQKNEALNISEIIQDNPVNPIKKPIPREIISAKEKDSPIFYFDGKKNRSTLLDEIEVQKRIVLLANGGMGKTTELIQFCGLCEERGFVPIFRTFKTYTNESIDDLLPTNWHLVQLENLIIILDGLDEVRQNEFSFALRKIRKFINENPLVKLVVSCRTNHLDVSLEQLGGEFTRFYLEEVSVYSPKLREFIEDYGVTSDAFVEAVFDRGFEDLAKNPFYLHRMLEIFKEKGSLDDNRVKLFEDFITSNFKFDVDKYKLTIDDIKLKSSLILKKLEHIAISMEACGLNSVDNQQLSNIINTDEDFEILKFNKSFFKVESHEKEHWKFEHRLIQEYLAARAMAQLEYDAIIELLRFENSERIIPGWANTITF